VTVRVLVMLDLYLLVRNMYFVSVKLVCVYVKLLKIKSASRKGIFVITEKPRVVFVKCIWIMVILK
jgi:hypothetical protein